MGATVSIMDSRAISRLDFGFYNGSLARGPY